MDELSVCSHGSHVAILDGSTISEKMYMAHDFGIPSVAYKDISPPANMSKGDFSKKILFGEIDGPALTMVLANADLLIQLASEAPRTLTDCFNEARGIHASGEVRGGEIERIKHILKRR